jgi:ketosteroid isomerase-like protein
MATQHAVDEATVREQIDKLVEAIRAGDLEGLKTVYARAIVSFDAAGPLECAGAEGKLNNWLAAFTMFKPPLGYELRDLGILSSGDVAFAHAFARLSGTLKSGAESRGFWVRATFCFQRIDGTWLVAHDHASVPLDMETGKALIGLEP